MELYRFDDGGRAMVAWIEKLGAPRGMTRSERSPARAYARQGPGRGLNEAKMETDMVERTAAEVL